MLKARPGDPIEVEIEHQQTMREEHLHDRAEVGLRVLRTRRKIRFDFHAQCRGEKLLRTGEDVFLVPLDVDLQEIGGRDDTLREQRVEPSDRDTT